MPGQRDTQQEISILADDVHEKRNDGRGFLISVVCKETPAIMPVPDACFGLPGFFLKSLCDAKLEVASQRAPYRFRNLLEVNHSFQAAPMRLYIFIVVIRHDLRREIGNA